MIKYKCGHQSEAIFLTNNTASFIAYEEWKSTTGFEGDKSQCFSCYCKELRANK